MRINSINSIVFLLLFFAGQAMGQITVNTNFDPAISAPIDVRMTIATLGDTTTIDWPYEGLLVHVDATDTYWKYNGTTWEEFQVGDPADGQGINLASNGLSTTTSGGDTTVVLGGTLTQPTVIDASGTGNSLYSVKNIGGFPANPFTLFNPFGIGLDDQGPRMWSYNPAVTLGYRWMRLDTNAAYILVAPQDTLQSHPGDRIAVIQNGTYSPTTNQYTGRISFGSHPDSLATKQWVRDSSSSGGGADGQGINLASNGLSTTTSGGDTTVVLGGSLTQNTTIEGEDFNLTIDSLAELEVQADTFRVSRGPNTLTGSIMSMEGESELINRNGKMTIYNPTDGYPGPVLISGTSGDRPILEILDGTNGNRATGMIRAAIAGAQVKMDKVGTVDITYDSLVFRGNAHVWTISDDEAPSPTLGDTTVLATIGTGSPGTARGKFVDINTIRARGPAFDGGSLYITTSNPDTIDYTGAGGTFFQIQDMTAAALDRFTVGGDTLYYTRPLYERAFNINFHASFTANQSNTAAALEVQNNGTAIPGCRVEARYVTSGQAVTLSGSCRADLDDTASLTLALQIGSSAASEVVISYANLNVN